LMYEVVKQR